MKHLKSYNEMNEGIADFFIRNKRQPEVTAQDGEWEYEVNLPLTSIPCIVTLKDGSSSAGYLEFNHYPYRNLDKEEYPDPYIWVIGGGRKRRDVKLDDVKSWRHKNEDGKSDWQVKYDRWYK